MRGRRKGGREVNSRRRQRGREGVFPWMENEGVCGWSAMIGCIAGGEVQPMLD